MTQKQKIRYIIVIALFNIPSAAIYLLMTRKRVSDSFDDIKDEEIDVNTRQGVFVLLVSAFEIFSLLIIAENIGNVNYPLIITSLTACFVALIINGIFIKKHHVLLYYLLPALQIAFIIPVEYLDKTRSSPFIILVVVAGIINNVPLRFAKIYSIISFFAYLTASIIKFRLVYGLTMKSDEVISYLYVNILVFLLVFLAFYSLNKQLLANKRLETAMKTLKEQSLKLEEMGAIAERNRITGEIHDTVGHTLTSAVISIEAGEKLLDQNRPDALEKFSLAKEQVKRGLSDIRSSVSTIQTGCDKSFALRLEHLLDDIHRNTGLNINAIIEFKTEPLPIQQNVLLRAVKECATNCLKHGNSTVADLLLQEYKGAIRLTFSDNGEGTDNITFGFGLNSMSDRIKSIGGTLIVESTKSEGFTVSISIPLGISTGGNKI